MPYIKEHHVKLWVRSKVIRGQSWKITPSMVKMSLKDLSTGGHHSLEGQIKFTVSNCINVL